MLSIASSSVSVGGVLCDDDYEDDRDRRSIGSVGDTFDGVKSRVSLGLEDFPGTSAVTDVLPGKP